MAAAPFWTLQAPLFGTWQATVALAGCLFWLAAIWLLLAWLHHNGDLFTAGQCVLTAASAMAATAWLQAQPWVARFPDDLLDPRSLQTYGIALGVLSLGLDRRPNRPPRQARPHGICSIPASRPWTGWSGTW